MKNLLLILALFVGNSFAEDKYPIELTCEIGENIIFFFLGEPDKDSWFEIHKSNVNEDKIGDYFGLNIRLSKKNFLLKKPKIYEEMIIISTKIVPLPNSIFFINRLTGKVTQQEPNFKTTGSCFSGVKEYKGKKF